MKIILVFLFIISSLFGFDYDKYLKSEIRAQVKLQKLVEDEGNYKEASNFGKLAYNIYEQNLFITSYYAKAIYLTGNLEESKILFMKILSVDPTNDIASEFVKKIEEQEAAKTNKDLENTLNYLSDKGLDFLMIFLGFLGAEVLAKRYNNCESDNYKNHIDHYIYFSKNGQGIIQKVNTLVIDYFKTFFTICNLLLLIIIVTIAAAISIVLNWMELMGYFSLLVSQEKLQIINSDELWIHFLVILSSTIVFIVLSKFITKLFSDTENNNDVANVLQELALNNEFDLLKECTSDLIDANINMEQILKYCVNDDAKNIILNMITICNEEKGISK